MKKFLEQIWRQWSGPHAHLPKIMENSCDDSPKRKIYTVQIKPCYRFYLHYNNGYENIERRLLPYSAVFLTKEQAEEYILNAIPNFVPDFENVSVFEDEEGFWHEKGEICHDGRDGIDWMRPWQGIWEKIQELNLPEPDNSYEDDALRE
jgi:hypothetical protein